MTILDEIEVEAWHILTSIYTHQRMIEALPKSPTRHELANQFVALNALSEMLVIRTARLADKRRDMRSVSTLLKRGNFSPTDASIKIASKRFIALAEPVVTIRHEQIAHMKPGVLSSYEPKSLPSEVIRAIEALIDLIDVARGYCVSYTYKVGSMEAIIDLRTSFIAGQVILA